MANFLGLPVTEELNKNLVRNTIIAVVGILVFLMITLFARKRELEYELNSALSLEDYEEAWELTENSMLKYTRDIDQIRLHIAKELAAGDLTRGMEKLRLIDTDEARKTAGQWEHYLKYAGYYYRKNIEKDYSFDTLSEYVQLRVENGVFYYKCHHVEGPFGKPIQGSYREGYKLEEYTVDLDPETMVLTIVLKLDCYGYTKTMHYISENSPVYQSGEYLSYDDSWHYSIVHYPIPGDYQKQIEESRKKQEQEKETKSSGSTPGKHKYDNDGYDFDPDDYDDPDEYADDAWGNDFEDWDDAYDAWENN